MEFRTDDFYGIRKIVVPLILFFILIITACGNKIEKEALAKFSGGEVTQKEYIDHYLLSTQYKPDKFPTLANLKEIVSLKAMEKLTVLEAFEMGLDKDSSYQEIAKKNVNRIIYYHYMRTQIIDSIIIDSLVQEFYSHYTPQHRMYYIIRPVLKTSTKEFENSQRDTIYYVFKLLKHGQKFEDLAKKYSQDITTNKKGGDLGFVIRESMGDAKLRAVMDTLKSFSYSNPVRGYEGYYILYKGEQRDVPLPPFSTVKAKIWNTLFHTRRHLIREKEKVHFKKYAEEYNYKENINVKKEIIEKAGGKNADKLKLLDFDKLTEDDMNKIIATYNQGSIKVYELFAQRKKAPDNLEAFEKKLNTIAQQHILACRARDLGLHNSDKLKQQAEKMRHSLLRTIFMEKEIKEKAQVILDSLKIEKSKEMKGAKLNDYLQKKRFELEKEFKSNIEKQLKAKYNFKFIEKNFTKALDEARNKKEQQNLERSKSKK